MVIHYQPLLATPVEILTKRKEITANEKQRTFIRILVKASEGIDLVIATVGNRGIDKTRWDISQGLLDSWTVVGAATSTFGWAGRH